MEILIEKKFIFLIMKIDMRENGKIFFKKEKDLIIFLMEIAKMETTKMAKKYVLNSRLCTNGDVVKKEN